VQSMQSFLDTTGVEDEARAVQKSVRATVTRNPIYKVNTTATERAEFRNGLATIVQKISGQYDNTVNEAKHIKNIVKISDSMSQKYGHVLAKGRLRIGAAQKCLNLYLKYLWCLKKIPAPPHCPIDSIVLRNAKVVGAWTKLDSIDTYKCWIASLKKKAKEKGYDSLPEWEIKVWNES